MRKRQFIAALATIAAAFAPVSRAGVTVQFIEPEKFADLSLSGSTTAGIQRHIMDELTNYLKYLGDHYLLPNHEVDVAFLDIDMGGEYEPWRTRDLTQTRFVREVYVPRMDLRYVWRDAEGKVLADTRERVSDLNYLMLADPGYVYNDPLRYEKAMLRRWFLDRFSALPTTSDAAP
ncbi:MAG: DUF3016 domain-containing protein [bacterium]